jgi:twitching motility protein PilT
MPEAFNLRRMLAEIAEDEKVSTSKRTKVSQADIKKLLMEKRGDREETPAGNESGFSPDPPPSVPVPDELEGTDNTIQQDQLAGINATSSAPPDPLSRDTPPRSPAEISRDDLSSPGCGRPILHMSDGVLPARIILKYRVIPLRVGERVLELAMENPEDLAAIYDVEILTGRRVEPVKVRREVLDRSLRLFSVDRMVAGFAPASAGEPRENGLLSTLLDMLVVSEGSDLLITQGASPWIKTPGHMESTGLPAVTALDCVRCAKSLMTEEHWEHFLAEGIATFSHQDPVHGRFRVQVFRERGAPSLVIRRVHDPIPTIGELGLPSWVAELALSSSGFIIVGGAAGHGKTTTIHAMVNHINQQKVSRIITLEDPVEVLHRPANSQIIQREIGRDVGSQREGIRQAMKQGAHVIVLGELTSSGAFLEALAAAESGRLVLTTFEAGCTSKVWHRLIHAVPHPLRPRALSMMESTAPIVLAQKLLSTGFGSGARPDCRKLDCASEMGELLNSPGSHSKSQ